MSDQNQDFEIELTVEELQEMLKNKILENAKLIEETAKLNNEVASTKARAMKVFEENTLLKADPEIVKLQARFDFKIKMADQLIKSEAFPNITPEQAYTIIQAGEEMGLKPIQSLKSLYCVKGGIEPYGKFMTSRIKEHGYSIQYLDENDHGLTVRVWNETTGEDYSEVVTDKDQILLKSKAMTFAKKNKMRYHGLRMMISFQLAHLFGSISDPFEVDALDHKENEALALESGAQQKERERLLKFITKPGRTAEQLQTVYSDAILLDLEDEIQTQLNTLKMEVDEQE